jgi:hypothetical protein
MRDANLTAMNAKRWMLGVLLIVIGATVAAVLVLRRENAKLRGQLVELSRRHETVARLREDNRQTHELLRQAATDEQNAAQTLHSELLRLRREAAELEARARSASDRKAAVAAMLATNRDPEKEMTRLEYFQDVGRATPSAAFQTLVWAALKGDDHALAASLALNRAARGSAEELLARLSADVRAKYPTAESLAALVVTGKVVKSTAMQVLGYRMTDAQRAELSIRSSDFEANDTVPLKLSADGWQVVVSAGMIDALKKRLSQLPETPPRK